ncbi:MAG: hypothetical protein HZB85_00630 [Deltaproteobacteria bacterium]|nr:hypothetical protein [Deltaproteobacteria bacterium]
MRPLKKSVCFVASSLVTAAYARNTPRFSLLAASHPELFERSQWFSGVS